MRCGACGRDNRPGRKFCAQCGAALGWACTHCSFVNDAGEGFCGGCGRPPSAEAPKPAPASETETGGERRQVAVLFADLCGFTALSRRLDAEDLRRLVEDFYRRADAIVAAYGGTVDKHMGDAVMALFGAPIAHGDDALRAVGAALDIASATGEIAGPDGAPLGAHIGIAMGEVIAGGIGRGYTVLGDAVNLASRLVHLAAPGQTVMAEELKRQLEGQVRAAALAPTMLKGFAEPVTAWRVEGLENLRRPTSPYVGRETDRRLLTSLLEACAGTGRGRIVVLRGEAGIGKSRLVEEAMSEAADLGFATHKALVLDFGAGRGLDARGMLTRSLLGLSPASGEAERRAAGETAIASGVLEGDERRFLHELLDLPVEGEDRALIQAMDEATRQARRRALVVRLLGRLSRSRPLFAAIEDLHWADPALLDDLAALGAASASSAVLLALTTRPEGDPLDRAWRSKLGPAAVSTIDLAPLSAEESAALAAGYLEAGDERIAACIQRAGGNPFFLEQLLRHTGEVASASVPASVQSLVLGRADRLPPEEKRALQAASVLGQRMALEALRHLVARPTYGAERLIDQQFMRREGSELAFVHALVRDGIYASLLKARRRELHRAAALWYGKRDLALGALHLELAEAEEAPAAFLAAADAAAAAYRFDQALDLAGRGLALVRDPATRVGLATLKGELLQGLGRTAEAVETLKTAAAEAETGRPRLRAWRALAQSLTVLDRLDEALALLGQAEAEAKARGLTLDLSRIHTLKGDVHFPRGEIVQCLAEHSEALRLAEAAGATEEQARALGGLADAYYMRGRFRTAGKTFQRCVEISAAHGFRRSEAANLPMLGMMSMLEIQFDTALERANRAIALAEQIGHPRAAMIGYHGLNFVNLELGNFEPALEAGVTGTRIARALGARRFVGEGLILQAISEYLLGRASAMETIREAIKVSREWPAYILPYGLAAAAMITSDSAERAAALGEGEATIAAGAVSHNVIFFNRMAIEACLTVRDWAGVERYADALAEGMAEEPTPVTEFVVARARALAVAGRGRKDETELKRLIAQARAVNWRLVLPALEAALGSA
jgi:class 3 adenylate cyclase/tetratricopeptide (TPR) repeat protein